MSRTFVRFRDTQLFQPADMSFARKNCLIRRGRNFSVLSNANFIHSEKAKYPIECFSDSLCW